MFNKKYFALIIVLLLTQVFSSFALAADNSIYYNIENTIFPSGIIYSDVSYTNDYYYTQKIYKDFDSDGIYEVAVIFYDTFGYQHLEIYKVLGQKMIRVFSGKGNSIRISDNSFSITNVEYDGRYFYETYTYQWGNGKFLRTGYAKTYIKDGYIDYKKPIKEEPIKVIKDARVLMVNSLLRARMDGNYDLATKYISKAYSKEINSKDIKSIIPYGKVTAVDIFESKRGDWVVAVIKDSWGRDRVFKFVPIEEKDKYSNFKVEQIVEIPRAN